MELYGWMFKFVNMVHYLCQHLILNLYWQKMMIPFLNTIVLLGALQGFVFGCLLRLRPPKKKADSFLGLLLLLLSLASLNVYLNESFASWQMGAFLDLVPMIIGMAFGPLIYLYTLSLLEPSFSWKRRYWLHFLPVVLDVLPAICAWVLAVGFWSGSFNQGLLSEWGNTIDLYNSYADIPRWISITAYVLVARRYFLKYRTDSSTPKPHSNAMDTSWVAQYLKVFYAFQVIWLVFLIFYIIPSSRHALLNKLGYYPIHIPLALLIYVLGLRGYLYSRSRRRPTGNGSIHLDQVDSEKLVTDIRRAMEEDKMYLRPDFDLGQLVEYVDSDQRKVSHVLNHNFSKSFNAFVNYYRIEEVKRRMMDPNKGYLTLTGIAFECGFNSQSTFQRAFRQYTGLSPKAYLSSGNKT